MWVTLYFHPSCATSRDVILGLRMRWLLTRVELVPLLRGSDAIRLGVWSVPWILFEGRPAITDPTDADEVVSALNGSRPLIYDPLQAFMNAVIHSSFATSVALVNGSISPVADAEFASAAVRSPLTGIDPGKVADAVAGQGTALFLQWRDKLRRAAAVSYVRELYWASGGNASADDIAQHATPTSVGAWLMAKASVGRVALPPRPKGASREDAEWIASFVRRSSKGLLEKVREEQERIYGDPDYVALLSELGVNIPP